MGAGGGDCAAVRAELRRPGLSGGGGLREDIGIGEGTGRGAIGGTGAALADTTGMASFLTALTTLTAAMAVVLGGVVKDGLVLPTGFASDFTTAFNEGLADCCAALPGKVGFVVGSADEALATLGLAVAPAGADLRTGADAPVAAFVAGTKVAFDFFSGDFTMCLLWNASCSGAAGGSWKELSP